MRRLLLPLAVLTACQSATQPSPAIPAASQGVTELVVANQQSASASVLADDGVTMKHLKVGPGPHEAMVSPDGRLAVVTVYGAQQPGHQLAVIDLVRDTVVRTIELGTYTRPHGVMFLGGSNDRVVVTSEATSNVLLVTLSTGAIEPIPTNARASHMVAVDRTGTRAWTANVLENSVSELDLAGRKFVRSFPVPARPEGIAATPDGAEVWVGSNETGTVTVLNTKTGNPAYSIMGATFPYRLSASPDGTRMAVVDGQGSRLLIADVAAHAYVGALELPSPRGVIIAPDNRTGYVTLAGGEVAVVDIVAMKELRRHAVQASPDGVGVGVRR